jgi:hypothetical protein
MGAKADHQTAIKRVIKNETETEKRHAGHSNCVQPKGQREKKQCYVIGCKVAYHDGMLWEATGITTRASQMSVFLMSNKMRNNLFR